ncbi:MAG: type II toxin-antitoxin system Phd/YefM family antitoxin [Armatimonadetes bacterium]|nr:type II toxin-antitoxin system Phd/YefM family antitoxin [Armatimonadota bacterium]
MESVGIFEAKTHLSELVKRAAKGETIVITMHGKPTARLMPVEEATPKMSLDEVIEAIRQFRARHGSFSIDELIAMKHEGHRY